jgi:hypothetical protein
MEPKGVDVLAFSSTAQSGPMTTRRDVYKETGVDTAEADDGLKSLVRRIEKTWPPQGLGRVLLRTGLVDITASDGQVTQIGQCKVVC